MGISTSQTTYTEAPAPKFPQLNLEMTSQQFWIDWDVFAKIMNMQRSQANIHLYNFADEAVQNVMVNTHPDFNTNPDELLGMVEALVTQRLNSIVHRLTFASVAEQKWADAELPCPPQGYGPGLWLYMSLM